MSEAHTIEELVERLERELEKQDPCSFKAAVLKDEIDRLKTMKHDP
jgi:hypothetical protein